jgi:hypothetical protein
LIGHSTQEQDLVHFVEWRVRNTCNNRGKYHSRRNLGSHLKRTAKNIISNKSIREGLRTTLSAIFILELTNIQLVATMGVARPLSHG